MAWHSDIQRRPSSVNNMYIITKNKFSIKVGWYFIFNNLIIKKASSMQAAPIINVEPFKLLQLMEKSRPVVKSIYVLYTTNLHLLYFTTIKNCEAMSIRSYNS